MVRGKKQHYFIARMDFDKKGKWKKICPGLHRETDLLKMKKPLISKSKLTAL